MPKDIAATRGIVAALLVASFMIVFGPYAPHAAMATSIVSWDKGGPSFVPLIGKASSMHVRPSTPADLSAQTWGDSRKHTRLIANWTWKTPDGLIWHSTERWYLADAWWVRPSFVQQPLPAGAPVTLVVPLFDYARASNYAVSVNRTGNEIYLDEFRTRAEIVSSEFRYPEDLSKEYLQPLGALPPGNYAIVATSYEVTHANPWAIDFAAFQADPRGYVLPSGAALAVNVERIEVTVVPEPATAGLAGCTTVAMVSLRRRRLSHRRWPAPN